MFSMNIAGLAELQRKLREMPEAAQTILEEGAVEEGAEVIAGSIRGKSPVKSGKLKATVKAWPATKKGERIRARVTAGDKEVYWAAAVEFGHFAGDRRLGSKRAFVPGHPFVRPGFDEKVGTATQRIGIAVAAGVEKFWGK